MPARLRAHRNLASAHPVVAGPAPDSPVDQVVALCVFPDESAIDEWGIAYMSEGTVRGADLSALFRVDPADTPPIFGQM